ncbi:MAG: competence/damage-inducible protein A [Bacteroidales bacterium]
MQNQSLQTEIISIGDELLIGQVVNTNSSWLAETLNLAGMDVRQITAVADERDEILRALQEAENRADVILMTGGLGPTKDDITKTVLCDFFDDHLLINQGVLDNVRSFFQRKGVDLTKLNEDQALVPSKAVVLDNPVGTAPGLLFRKKNKVYVAMPGVPYEMKYLTEKYVVPQLLTLNQGQVIVHKTVLTQGLGESFLAEKIDPWVKNLPGNIKLAYLPSPGIVRLRLTAHGDDLHQMEALLKSKVEELKKLIPWYFWGMDKEKLEEVTGKLLKKAKATLVTAESCTGGYIAHRITGVPGSSDYFHGSVVAYSNKVKSEILDVKEETLNKFGAVSKQVAEQMASGAKKMLHATYAIATTGIAGPGGGTDEKPVGTVWISIDGPNGIESKKFTFGDQRDRNIIRTGNAALGMLRNYLIKYTPDLP